MSNPFRNRSHRSDSHTKHQTTSTRADRPPTEYRKSTNPYVQLRSDKTLEAAKKSNSRAKSTFSASADPNTRMFNEPPNHTSILINCNHDTGFLLTFSPYWKIPFNFKWAQFPISLCQDIIASKFPVRGHDIQKKYAMRYTLEPPFTTCPFSKRLAWTLTERKSAWGPELHTCIVYCAKTMTMTARVSPLIGNRKCRFIALSPDGQYIALGGEGKSQEFGTSGAHLVTVVVRRLIDGTTVCETTVPKKSTTVRAISFDADSKRLAVLSYKEQASEVLLLIFDIRSSETIQTVPIVQFEWDYEAFGRGSALYGPFPILLFLPDNSIIMFHAEALLESAKPHDLNEIYRLHSRNSGAVDTIPLTFGDTLSVRPEGRIHAIRILRERWEMGKKPVTVHGVVSG